MQSRFFWRWSMLSVFVVLLTTLCSSSARAVTFSVSGSRILKDGNEFVIKGVNVNGPNWGWARGSAQDADLIVNKWQFNTVRVQCVINTSRSTENQDLVSLVNSFTNLGCVVELEVHDLSGTYATASSSPSLNQVRDWWVARANDFRGNPYVWFDLFNEPGGGGDRLPRIG